MERGAGMFQAGLAAAEARLKAGDWVHIFPEGTRSKDGSKIGPARKGVGRLVAACAAEGGSSSGGEQRPAPLVVPFVHSGMHELMPRGALVPRAGKEVRVLVGEPVEVADLLAAARRDGWPEDELYKRIAARVGLALQSLKARLDGAPLDADALSALAREQASASGLDLYDPRDRHANKAVGGWRAAGAARWVHSLRERVEFKALHRDWAVRGVAAAALERVTGGPPGGTPGSAGGGEGLLSFTSPGLSWGAAATAAAAGGHGSGHGTSGWAPWAAASALHGYGYAA